MYPQARFEAARYAARLAVAAALAAVVAACAKPPPRSFVEFMDDRIAREGVLARCDLDPEASQNDIECANARRAAATIALREERARREQLERESEHKLQVLREQIELREHAAREAVAAAVRAAEQAYEAQWENGAAGTVPAPLPNQAAGNAPGPAAEPTPGASEAAPARGAATGGAALEKIAPPRDEPIEAAP